MSETDLHTMENNNTKTKHPKIIYILDIDFFRMNKRLQNAIFKYSEIVNQKPLQKHVSVEMYARSIHNNKILFLIDQQSIICLFIFWFEKKGG